MLAWLRLIRDLYREFVPSRDLRALILQVLGIVAVSLALGVALHGYVPVGRGPYADAEASARRGHLERAEELYWAQIRRGPVTVPLLLAFIDNHDVLTVVDALSGAPSLRMEPRERERVVVSDEEIEALLSSRRLSPNVALVARYYWDARRDAVSPDLEERIRAAADGTPPVRWANHVLARVAGAKQDFPEAARRFEREGLAFRRTDDLRRALELWVALDDWDTVARKVRDRRWAPAVDPFVRHEVALEEGDWANAARWLFIDNLSPELAPLLLALVAGLMWFLFVARLGKLGERRRFRGAMFALAFVLGVLSVGPTLLVITLEDHFLHLEPNGEIVRDAIYYVAGVGFREELCKLLLFAPLLPILRKWGSKIDVLACGAMVGLGFAVEENLRYFASDAGASALGRFLTANFLHITMTALCADALDHFARDPGRRSMDFSITFLTIVGLHGAYDFFAANPAVGDLSFLSVVVFVILTRKFLTTVTQVRGRPDAHDKFLRRLVQAIAVVAGASFVYACSEVGPGPAAAMIAVGLLGDAIIIYIFVHEARHT